MKGNALITGGTRGIGLGIARQLANDGYNLLLNGVREEADVSEVLDELRELGTRIVYCPADISTTGGRNNLVAALINQFETINVLVNNAGVAPAVRDDLLDLPEESYDRVMTINLKGPFFLTQQIANHMIMSSEKDAGYKGCIINIGSVSATMASTNRGQYCISKAGIAMMTRLFAVRLGEFGIPVYEVRPGVISTDMTAGVIEKYQKLQQEGLFVDPRLGTPDDVGRVVAGLAAGVLPYGTGNVISVDGGLTIPRL